MSIKKIALAGGVAATLMAGTAYASVIDRPFFQVLGVVVVWGADDSATTAPVVSDFVLLTPAGGTAGADLIGGQNVNTVITGSLTPVDGTGTAASATAVNPVTGATSGGALTDAAGAGAGILDASDSLSAFGIDGSTDVSGLTASHTSSFFVASNAAFDINAVAGGLAKTGDFATDADIGLEDISLVMSTQAVDNVAGHTVGSLSYGLHAQDPGTFVGGAATGVDLAVVAAAGATGLKVFDGTQRTAATPGSLADQSVRFDNVYDFGGASGYDLSMGSGTISAQVTYTIFVP